jgi:large subunit ribosomal protein L32e
MGGRPKSVEIGYGSPKQIRGRNGSGHEEVLVFNAESLSKVNQSQVVRIGHVVGQRKRVSILEKARTLGLYVVNPGSVGEVES